MLLASITLERTEFGKCELPCTFARYAFAVIPEAEAGKRCYSTAGTKGWAPAVGGVFGSLVCRALQKALCGQCCYWKLVFSSTTLLILTKQNQEN